VDFDAILYCANRIKIAEGVQSPYLEGKSHSIEHDFTTLYRIPKVIFYSWKSNCIEQIDNFSLVNFARISGLRDILILLLLLLLFPSRNSSQGTGPRYLGFTSHSDTPHGRTPLDQWSAPTPETSTWQHATLTTGRHTACCECCERRRPKRQTARPL